MTSQHLMMVSYLLTTRFCPQSVLQWRGTTVEDDPITYDDVCGRLDGECLVWGDLLLKEEFWQAYLNGTLTFPFWESPWGIVDLSAWLGTVNRSVMMRRWKW